MIGIEPLDSGLVMIIEGEGAIRKVKTTYGIAGITKVNMGLIDHGFVECGIQL